MKKRNQNIYILLILLLSMILSSYTYKEIFTNRKPPEEIKTSPKTLGTTNLGTFIKKTETVDAILYSVTDFDRDLTYSWKFKKEENRNISVEENLNINADLRLSIDAMNTYSQTIDHRVDQNKLIISFDHHGELPLEATVRINVGEKFQEKEKLYLYYFNPESDQIEYIAHNVEVKDGYVEFTINHCSDYFLTAAVVNDAVNNPKSVNYIIIGLVAVVFILIAVTLSQSRNK